MKAQIQYKTTDGSVGVALIASTITSTAQAQKDLANRLKLATDDQHDEHDIDARLRQHDIDPDSVIFSQLRRF